MTTTPPPLGGPTTTPSLWTRAGRAGRTGLALIALAAVVGGVWYFWPFGFGGRDNPRRVAGGGDQTEDRDDQDDDVTEPAKPAGRVGITCDTSLEGVRWNLEDSRSENGRTLSVWHGGSHWDVHNVFCETVGETSYLTFENDRGQVKPVLASCLQVSHGPQDGRDYVKVAKTAQCPKVTCWEINSGDCTPQDRAVPRVTPKKADINEVLRLQQRILDGQDGILERLDTNDERLDALEERVLELSTSAPSGA